MFEKKAPETTDLALSFFLSFYAPKKSYRNYWASQKELTLIGIILLFYFFLLIQSYGKCFNGLYTKFKTYILIGNNNNKKTVALIIRFSLIKQKRNVWLVHKLYSIRTPSTVRLTTGVSFLVDSIGISPGHSAKCFLDAQL